MRSFATTPALEDPSASDEPPSGIRVSGQEDDVFDEEAFRAFATRQTAARSVRRCARALHVPEDVAADTTQEALLSLWRASSREDRDAALGRMVHKTMLRCAYSYSRARSRARKYGATIVHQLIEQQTSVTPEAELHLQQCERESLRLVERLRPERRDVVKLYLLDERPMKEVAAQLAIPEDTAKNRWRLAQADMGRAFRRERAKERFLALAAVFVVFFTCLWARLVGRRRSRRAGPILACAALTLVVSHRGERASTVSMAAAAEIEETPPPPSSRLEYTFAPTLTAFAERELERAAPIVVVDPRGIEVTRVLLAQADAALGDGRTAVARTYLAQYDAAFPRDPDERSARQRAAISAELAAR